MAPMSTPFAALTVTTNALQRAIIEEVLRTVGVPFELAGRADTNAALGAAGPDGPAEFRVPVEKLQETKELLCAHGIVCEVSERLLRRALDEIVKPLLKSSERDLERLVYFAGVNSKETLRALFDATLLEPGGDELLSELFFLLARERSEGLCTLARALRGRAGAGFSDRYHSELTTGPKDVRIELLGALPELPPSRWRLEALAEALFERDGEIRAAASEALFAMGGGACGYDPDDPPAEREAAVRQLLAGSFALKAE
jgi:hypothetical protein